MWRDLIWGLTWKKGCGKRDIFKISDDDDDDEDLISGECTLIV